MPIAAEIDYRRQARHLRAVHSRSPAQLQHALSELASRTNNRKSQIPEPISEVRLFASSVLSSLDGSILPYSRRKQLIQQAAALGIRRFDANLLIAAVQHRLSPKSSPVITTLMPPTTSAQKKTWLLPACVIVLLQSAICGTAYLLFHS